MSTPTAYPAHGWLLSLLPHCDARCPADGPLFAVAIESRDDAMAALRRWHGPASGHMTPLCRLSQGAMIRLGMLSGEVVLVINRKAVARDPGRRKPGRRRRVN